MGHPRVTWATRRGNTDLVVLFASRMAELYVQFPPVERSLNDGGRLWIAWPKQASGVKTDVTQPAVREFGLAAGWVDFKICAIDKTWSGLAFGRRNAKADRAAHYRWLVSLQILGSIRGITLASLPLRGVLDASGCIPSNLE